MEAGRRLISLPSIHPPKAHATISLSFSVPVIHDQAAPAVAYMPTTSIAHNFPACLLMQEQHDDFRSSHIIREGRAQLAMATCKATLDRRWIKNEEVFCWDIEALNIANALKILNVKYFIGRVSGICDVLALAKKAVPASKAAASLAKESNYLSAEFDESLVHSLVPKELFLDVPVENQPMVKSRRLMQRKLKKRKVSKKPKAVTNKVSSFRAIDKDEKINYDDFDLNDPRRLFLWGPEAKQLLTEKEEQDLFVQIRELMKLEKVKHILHSQFDREPMLAEWAKAFGMSCRVLKSYLRSGNSSREKMIVANFRLVIHVAKQYQGRGLSLHDLLQEGSIGLMKSLEKFQPQDGCRFSSYAFWWIQQSIRKAIFYNSRTIRLPENVSALLTKITNAKKACIQEGHHPTNEELAKRVGITTEKFQMLLSCTRIPVSIQQSAWADQDVTFQEVTADPRVDLPDQIVTKQLMRRHVRNLLSILTMRERQIIWLRYGIHDGMPKSLSEIGSVYGLSKERVRQVEHKALNKLKQCQGLEAYTDLLI